MRRLLLACALALTLPTAAGAAPLHELPYVERPTIACLAPTGVPGGLTIVGAYSERDVTTELLTDGATPAGGVSVGRLYGCASLVDSQGGTAVVAGGVEPHSELHGFVIHGALRDPGGAFGAPVRLGRGDPDPAVAVGPAGHAVVAWVERSRRRDAIVAVRRAPGAAFGPPETVLAWRPRAYSFSLVDLHAGVDAAGRVTLLWRRDHPVSEQTHVEAASAAQGAPFAVQRLAARVQFPDPVLAVAPDGWALAAYGNWGRRGGAIFERAPGAPGFTRVALAPPRYSDQPVVAIRDGGGGLVGWRRETSEKIEVATRVQAGAFGTPRVVARGWSVNEILAFEPFTPRPRLQLAPVDFDEPRPCSPPTGAQCSRGPAPPAGSRCGPARRTPSSATSAGFSSPHGGSAGRFATPTRWSRSSSRTAAPRWRGPTGRIGRTAGCTSPSRALRHSPRTRSGCACAHPASSGSAYGSRRASPPCARGRATCGPRSASSTATPGRDP